jgi:peptidoglycan/LPS O-acetylase OafA/YrhL
VTDLSENKKPLHFVQLDTLRFLAAFMIIFLHAFHGWTADWPFGKPWRLTGEDGNWNWFGSLLHGFISNLGFGVDVFFLISGFLITYLLIREKTEQGKINIPGFFMRRILRIWPLYFFIIAISPFLVQWLDTPDTPHYLSAALFYNNFHTIAQEANGMTPWVYPFAHFWSICIEEHFYLIWPFLVMLIPFRRLPAALLLIIVGSMAYRAYAFYFLPDAHRWFPIYMHTFSRIDALAIGGLAAWFHYNKPFTIRVPLAGRLLLYTVLIWGLCTDNLSDWPNIFDVIWKKYIYLLLAGFAMMNYVFNPDAKLKFGPKHPINYLGRCSYGIYLWGNILLPIIIQKFFLKYIPHPNGWTYWTIVLGISLLVPVITYELIEKPFLKLKTRFAIVKTRL